MNIVIKNNNAIQYKDLVVGNVFRHQDRTYIVAYSPSPGEETIAVDLENGFTEIFKPNAQVERFDNVELILENKYD